MNLTTFAETTDLRLTKPQMNLLAKLDAMGLSIDNPGNPAVVANPHTGYKAMLNPLVGTLSNFVYKVYSTYGYSGTMNYRGTKVAIGTFDRVRMLILSLDKQAYSDFID
jgi:hypothetical protein